MTVSSSANSVIYRGNGATTEFAVPFKVLDEDHLVVTRRVFATGEEDYVYIGTDYSYSGIGASSGTLTLAGTALSDTYELVIERTVPYTQDLDIVNAGGFFPNTVEEQLDLIVMGVQQIAALAERGIVVPIGEDGFVLPASASRASHFLAFDAGGDLTISTGTGSDTGVRTDLAASGGSALVSFLQSGTGAVARTVQSKLREQFVTPDDFSGTVTQAAQKALDASLYVRFTTSITITAALTLRSGHQIELAPGVTITQATAATPAFVATELSNVWIFLNGGAIRGPGGWLSSWTGNSGHEGLRGVRFLDGTKVGVVGPGRIFNWGNAGIEFAGGSDVRVVNVDLEGTTGYAGSDSIVADDNFQQCIYFPDNAAYGATNGAHISGCTFTGSAQGILREAQIANGPVTLPLIIEGCVFHDIPGQHCIYNQEGLLTVSACHAVNIAASFCKNQTAESGENISNISCIGITATNIGGSLFEIAQIGAFGGSVINITCQGSATDYGYLVSINGKVEDANITVSGRNGKANGNAVYCLGDGQKRVKIVVDAYSTGQAGIAIAATNSQIDLYPNIRQVNSSNAAPYGLHVSSASATVRVFDGLFVNTDALMANGVNVAAGSTVQFIGAPVIAGNTSNAIQSLGTLLGNLPQVTATYDIPSVANNAGVTFNLGAVHAAVGDKLEVTPLMDTLSLQFYSWVTAAGVATVRATNVATGGAVDLASGTFRISVTKLS